MTELELPVSFTHEPPEGYSYQVREHKRHVLSIWLQHHYDYVYSGGESVATIWGFYDTKKKQYHAPVNSRTIGLQVEISNTTPYTSMPLNLNGLQQLLYT